MDADLFRGRRAHPDSHDPNWRRRPATRIVRERFASPSDPTRRMSSFRDLARAAAAARHARPGVPLALATLVHVDGSSYRQPGARLLVDAEGRVLAGAVSGGCLEADVALRAADVCVSGTAVRLRYDLRADLETIWGFGAACDGVAHLLLEPLVDWRWMAQAEAVRARRQGGAVVTLLDAQSGGATSLLLDGSSQDGTWHMLHELAATLPRAEVGRLAHAAARTGHVLHHTTGDDTTVFVQPLVAPVALHLVGAGRSAEAFARLATTMNWDVTVLDHRPALLAGLELPPSVHRHTVRDLDSVRRTVDALPHDSRTAVALLSHIFDVDAAWLDAMLPLPVAYVGVLGSRARAAQLVKRVESRHGGPLSRRALHKLHAPIGLDIGGEDPSSIALSAIAEVEAVLHGRPGGFLRERQSPIHTRSPTPRLHDPVTDAPDRGPDPMLGCVRPEPPST
jgi:xanthine dehydrogenase accessory factor